MFKKRVLATRNYCGVSGAMHGQMRVLPRVGVAAAAVAFAFLAFGLSNTASAKNPDRSTRSEPDLSDRADLLAPFASDHIQRKVWLRKGRHVNQAFVNAYGGVWHKGYKWGPVKSFWAPRSGWYRWYSWVSYTEPRPAAHRLMVNATLRAVRGRQWHWGQTAAFWTRSGPGTYRYGSRIG